MNLKDMRIDTSLTAEQQKSRSDRLRSKVRRHVTYYAASFLFIGGALLIAFFLWRKQYSEAKQIFDTIVPISAGIIAYWFGSRSAEKKGEEKPPKKDSPSTQ